MTAKSEQGGFWNPASQCGTEGGYFFQEIFAYSSCSSFVCLLHWQMPSEHTNWQKSYDLPEAGNTLMSWVHFMLCTAFLVLPGHLGFWEEHQFLSSISANSTGWVKKAATGRLWFLSLKVLNSSLNFQLELLIEQGIYFLWFLKTWGIYTEVISDVRGWGWGGAFPHPICCHQPLLGDLIQEITNAEHLHTGTRQPQGQSD